MIKYKKYQLGEKNESQQIFYKSGEPGFGNDAHLMKSPMPGQVVQRLVKDGDTIQPGQLVAVVEAMKMENEIRSMQEGIVSEWKVCEGQMISGGDVLLEIEF